ncbi:MAG TPA: nucleoside deaminase [Vicinamibacterales bacterium]|nr:nucleoside deaminase [Vicinamibacterales bacterium]
MDEFLKAAIAEAEAGLAEGGVPIGSVLVHEGRIIGRGHNRRVQRGSAILHGEMDALENAGRRAAAVYTRSVLYTTLSPCAMCSGAILLYRIPRIVVGENVTFRGEEDLLRDRGVSVEVLQDARCIEMMQRFIREHPAIWNEDIGL